MTGKRALSAMAVIYWLKYSRLEVRVLADETNHHVAKRKLRQ
jgi:hypothetical protein